MKFVLKIRGNIYNLMRQAGYHLERKEEGKLVFSRPLSGSGSGYPKFHAYVSRETSEVNLHLDQKKPVYKDGPAHAAEYEGKIIEEEIERIKK